MTIWPGEMYPLGATSDGAGVNFAVYSEVARRVEVCLFDDDGVAPGGGSRLAVARDLYPFGR